LHIAVIGSARRGRSDLRARTRGVRRAVSWGHAAQRRKAAALARVARPKCLKLLE